MTRSCRRAWAMSWSVAIAVLHAGIGIASAAPAGAESDALRSEPPADRTQPKNEPASRAGGEYRREAPARASWQRRIGATTPAGATTPGRGPAALPDHWDCHWPPWPPVNWPLRPPLDGLGAGGGGNGLVLVAAGALGPPSVPAPPTTLGPSTDRILTGLTGAEPPPAAAPPAVPLGGPFPGPPPVPNTAVPSAPPATSSGPAAPASAAGPVPVPKAVAPQQNPLRAGYPGYLQNASPAQVAALALTGAAGLAALAGAGGFVGYRQAKAGFALRAAGTARFLS